MVSAVLLQFLLGLFAVQSASQFNNPPGVDIWCGKAYRAANSSFDPGGRLFPPKAIPKSPLLDLRFYPRMNLYLNNEESGSFIVDAPISSTHGLFFTNSTFEIGHSNSVPFTTLNITITNSLTGERLVPWSKVPVNSTGNEFTFSLRSLTSSLSTFPVHIFGVSPDGLQSYQSTSSVTVLPNRNDSGSVARIDQLYGGLQVYSPLTDLVWKPIFPYSFYTSWDWIASTINNTTATYNLSDFRASGYNLIHPVPPGGHDPFNHTLFEEFLKLCDSLELYVMYDMRHTYKNKSSITEQLSRLKQHPSLLLYYTADEPDGWCDPLNATKLSYEHIKSIDPYHPVSLCLNCANFYFDEYTRGTDIILEDTYPIAVNTSFSNVYHTPCNSTYGDCGCDNCHAGDPTYPGYVQNHFLDISTRLDDFHRYQDWLRFAAKKPTWGVPQAFFDQGSFWERFPTADEEAVMGILRLNHGAKGIVAWIFPTEDSLRTITGQLALVVGGAEVAAFTLGSPRTTLDVHGTNGVVDAAVWIKGGSALVSVVHLGYSDLEHEVEFTLPIQLSKLEILWGKDGWAVQDGRVTKNSMDSLETAILRISVE